LPAPGFFLGDTEVIMDETIERELRSALRIEEPYELPADIVRLYETIKRTCDRLGYRYSGELVVMTIVLAGYGIQAPLDTLIDSVDRGEVKLNDWVIVEWHGEPRAARYQASSKSDHTVTVQLVNDETAELRELPAAFARRPTAEELRSLNESA